MAQIIVRPATNTDLDTLLHFEQGVIAAERPFDPTLKPDPNHYYDIPYMIGAPEIELVVAELVSPPSSPTGTPSSPADKSSSLTDTSTSPADKSASPTGKLIGSGYARIEASKHYLLHTRHAYLGFMYVVPEHRGKGVNQLIIEALKQWSLSQNITELRLDVYSENQPAINAYEKAGFTKYLIEMRRGLTP